VGAAQDADSPAAPPRAASANLQGSDPNDDIKNHGLMIDYL